MRRRTLAIAAALVVAGAFGLHECAGGASAIAVRVDGRAVVVEPGARVREVLRAAHLRPHDGMLRAVETHAVLVAHWRRARVVLDGRRVGPGTQVRPGDRIRLVNGTNAVEPTVQRDLGVPSPGGSLPDV